MAMPDLQSYPWNLIMIKNVEAPIIFPTQKLFYSNNFSIISQKYTEKPKMNITNLKKKKRGYLILSWSEKAFKGTVVDWALPSLHGTVRTGLPL